MDDRERLEAIVSVVCCYLPPNGMDIKTAMSKIIELIDPLPPKREWVGLTQQEFEEAVDELEDLRDCWTYIEAKLKEKNGG